MPKSIRPYLVLSTLIALPLAAQVPPNVPTQYQAIYSNMSTQIATFQNTVSQSWNKTPYGVAWAPHLSSAESEEYLTLLGPTYYPGAVTTELVELQASGAKAVTVHINFPILYQPFYTYTNSPSTYGQFVAFYQKLVSDVHSRGMKLVVEATVTEALAGTNGAQFDPYYQTLDWNDFMTGRAQNAVNIAQLIQPDFLSLICEPDSEATNGFQPTENSPAGALQLLQTILAALQQAGVTNVTLGAGAGTWIANFTSYLQEFAALPQLSYVDMHVYPVNNSDLTNVITGATMIQQAGKAIGVSEAWPDKEANSELGLLDISTIDSRDVFSFWSPIDTAFLQAMVDCAQYMKFSFFSPSFPQFFAAYLNYNLVSAETPAQLLSAGFAASGTANSAGTFNSTGSAFSTMIVGPDTTAPTTPTAPWISTISSTGVTIAWTPTTDNVGVAGYNIYRNNVNVAQSALPTYRDTGLISGATYTYSLSAFDAQGNVSPLSPALTVTTINLTLPTVPTNLKASAITQNSITLSWSPSTVIGGVAGYRILKGTSIATMQIVFASVLTTTFVDTHVVPSTTYYYAVEAYNVTGMASAASATVMATTLALPPPTNLNATSVSKSSVSLSWTASGGTDAPVSYRILKGTSASSLRIIVAQNVGTTFTDSGIAPHTTYYYQVEMVDSLGLTSLPGNLLTVTSLQ